MERGYIISLLTMVIAWILGYLSRKNKFISNNLIPLQNLLVGIMMMLIEWIMTSDIKLAIAISGLTAGGTYDVVKNLYKLKNDI